MKLEASAVSEGSLRVWPFSSGDTLSINRSHLRWKRDVLQWWERIRSSFSFLSRFSGSFLMSLVLGGIDYVYCLSIALLAAIYHVDNHALLYWISSMFF